MLLFYVDECGDAAAWTAEDKSSSAYLVLAAVGIQDSARGPLARALLALKDKRLRLPDGSVAPQWEANEIKGRYLAQASRAVDKGDVPARAAFRSAFAVDQGKGLYAALRNLLNRYRPVVFVAVVDKARLLEAGNSVAPLGAAYAVLYQRVAQMLGNVFDGENAVFVADQQLEHTRYFEDGNMIATREAMNALLHRGPEYNLVLDKPLWIDPRHSVWDREIIQLADIVAYSAYELAKTGKRPDAPHYLWDAIHPWFARHWGTGEVARAGLTIFPKPSRYPTLT